MYFSSQKKNIISLVLVFGCIYAVNACAHPLAGSFHFFISNQAPSSDLSKITISSNSAYTVPCYNTSGNAFSIDIAGSDAPKRISIQFNIDKPDTPYVCYADIQYGGKYTTKVKITSVAATDGGNGPVIKSITRVNGDPLGSDQDFKDWNKKGIQIATPYSMSVDELTKGKDTLTYSSEEAKPIITLTNNAPPSTLGTNDITISSEGSPCMFKNQIAHPQKGGDKPTSFSIVPTTFYGTCKANIWYGNDATDTTPVTISWSGDSTNVKITLPSANSMSPTASPLAGFNTWNNTIAVHHGSMVKFDFSTAGTVNFKKTPLPFPLLPTPSGIDLDTLADDLLSKDLPTNKDGTLDTTQDIFYEYTKNLNNKTSRDIAQDMLIVASMMKLHSQIVDDTSTHNFAAWNQLFLNASSTGFASLSWDILGGTEKWKCGSENDSCYMPYHSSGQVYDDFKQLPDDTIAQTYLATAFQSASDALVKHNNQSTTQSDNYSKISKNVRSAIYRYNLVHSFPLLKSTQASSFTILLPSKEVLEPGPTYSDNIAPLIYLFSQDHQDDYAPIWANTLQTTFQEEGNTVNNNLMNLPQPNETDHILSAGTLDITKNKVGINMGDLLDEHSTYFPDMTFGQNDDADYVPMSLGAYLLVAGGDTESTQNLANSGNILKLEMEDIDGLDTAGVTLMSPYQRIKCSGSPFSNGSQLNCSQTKVPLTPLDMSSYLLAQLGLATYFGQQEDYESSIPVDNSAQIDSLTNSPDTSSFKSKIKEYGDDPTIDISPIILAGLYINNAFTPTPTDGTSFHNLLIDAHLNKSGDIHYYFTLDPTTSSTLGAQVRSGAQTSYSGE